LFEERGQARKDAQIIKMLEVKSTMHIIYIGIQEGEEGTFCVNRVVNCFR
jgi:hypothetical protein